jgi:hypothetical protein
MKVALCESMYSWHNFSIVLKVTSENVVEETNIAVGELIQVRFKMIYRYSDRLTNQQNRYKQRYCHV